MDIHWKQKHTGDMQVRQNNGVTYLSYPRLEQESAIVHGFSTRLGGVSEGYLGSMNLSFSRGDNRKMYWKTTGESAKRSDFR